MGIVDGRREVVEEGSVVYSWSSDRSYSCFRGNSHKHQAMPVIKPELLWGGACMLLLDILRRRPQRRRERPNPGWAPGSDEPEWAILV